MASAKRAIATIKLTASSIVLDIEGTTTSISFVKDVLFPYVRNNLESYLNENWKSSDFQECVKALKAQAKQDDDSKVEGVIMIPEEAEETVLKKAVIDNVNWQMDNDRKTKSLKDLQGLIMKKGYTAGDLKGHVYEDVEQSLKSWNELDKSVYIYSSGSVHAQKLLYGHTEKGDLLPLIKGHFDTTVGMKGDVNSYKEILKQINGNPSETVFFTDVPKEAKAAKEAGITAVLVSREGNSPLSDEDKAEFQVISSFEDVEFEQSCKKRKTSSSENTVNIDNKEVESCSLSIDEKNKPLSPQVAKEKESVDELMDVDESPCENTTNVDVKTNENSSDTKLEENLSEEIKNECINSDVKDESSKPEIDLCKNEARQIEDVDNMIENKKEETVNEEFKCNSEVAEPKIGNNETKTNNSDSKSLCQEKTDTQSKNEADKIENQKEESINSDAVASNEVCDINCKKDDENIEMSVENVDVAIINAPSKDIESVIKEEEENITCTSNEESNKTEDGNKENSEKTMKTEDNSKSFSGEEIPKEEAIKTSAIDEDQKESEEIICNLEDKKEDIVSTQQNGVERENSDENQSVKLIDEQNLENAASLEENGKLVESQNNTNSNDPIESSCDNKTSQISDNSGIDIKLDEAKESSSTTDVIECVDKPNKNLETIESNGNIETTTEDKNNEVVAELEEKPNKTSESNGHVETTTEKTKDKNNEVVAEFKETANKASESNGHVETITEKTEDKNNEVVAELEEKPNKTSESNGHVETTTEKTEDKNNEVVDEVKLEDDKISKVVAQNGDSNGISSQNLKTKENGLSEEALEVKKCNGSENVEPAETVVEA